MKAGRWLVYQGDPPPSGSTAVLHFPYAGGQAAAYRSWAGSLGAGRQYVGIELPGRGTRFGEPFAESIDEIADAVVAEVDQLLGRKLVLFGHSVGALMAYETTHRLEKAGREVAALIVSGNRAPDEDLGRPVVSTLPDDEFAARLSELGLANPEALADPEIAELFGPVLRADLRLCEVYPWGRSARIQAAMTVLGAAGDALAPKCSLLAWAALAVGRVEITEFEGGHMFVHEQADAVLRRLHQAMPPFVPR